MAKIFDVLPAEAGEAKVKTYPHPERTYYYKVDISSVDQVQAACTEALKVIPKGSLAGGVHCAAVATSRKWSNKMADSIKASRISQHFQSEADIYRISRRQWTSTPPGRSSSTPVSPMPLTLSTPTKVTSLLEPPRSVVSSSISPP